MTRGLSPQLEIIAWHPAMEVVKPAAPLLVLVHGAGHTAMHWQYMQRLFAQAGYHSLAVNLRGHGQSEGRSRVLENTLQNYVDDVRGFLQEQVRPRPYVLIGHSMGGYIVQGVCQQEQDDALVGVALLASVTPKLSGRAGMSLGLLWSLLRHPRSESLDPTQQFQHFPSPENGGPRPSVPMFIIGAEQDKMVPPALVKATAAAYGTTPMLFPRMGHDLMLDVDYQKVAAALMDWIEHLPVKSSVHSSPMNTG